MSTICGMFIRNITQICWNEINKHKIKIYLYMCIFAWRIPPSRLILHNNTK